MGSTDNLGKAGGFAPAFTRFMKYRVATHPFFLTAPVRPFFLFSQRKNGKKKKKRAEAGPTALSRGQN